MSRKFFTPPQPSPMYWGGSKKFTNDLGLLYMASDDLNQSETTDVRKVCSQRCQIKKNSRKIKELTGIEPCCRKVTIKTNHIACAILVWSFIKTAHLMGKTIYQLKSELLSEYLKNEFKYSVIR